MNSNTDNHGLPRWWAHSTTCDWVPTALVDVIEQALEGGHGACADRDHHADAWPVVRWLTIIELGPNRFQPCRIDAIGLAGYRAYEALGLEFLEDVERAVCEHVAIDGAALDRSDAARLVSTVGNGAALGEHMKCPLLRSGDVHSLESSGIGKNRRTRRVHLRIRILITARPETVGVRLSDGHKLQHEPSSGRPMGCRSGARIWPYKTATSQRTWRGTWVHAMCAASEADISIATAFLAG